MPMALHGLHQPNDHLAESFATDSIGGLPDDRQRLSNGFVVDSRPLSRFRSFSPWCFLQHADRVLAMKTRHLDELVKDLFLLVPAGGSIARRHRINQFPPRCHAQLPPQSATRPFHWDG